MNQITQNILGRNVVLVDIDHVLSAAWPRDHFIQHGDWDQYHQQAATDQPIHDMVSLVRALRWASYRIVAFTSRPEKWRSLTNQWLARWQIPIDILFMRQNDNYQTDVELKIGLATAYFADMRKEVAFLIEDREDVCRAFHEAGITTLQCRASRDD